MYSCSFFLLAAFLALLAFPIDFGAAAGLLDDLPARVDGPSGNRSRLSITVMPFSGSGSFGYPGAAGAVETTFAAALARTGRFNVTAPSSPRNGYGASFRSDIAIYGRILEFSMDATNYYTSVTGEDGRRLRRMYSHTTVDARLEVEISAVDTATGRVIGTRRAWSSDSDTFSGHPGMGGHHDLEPGYFLGGTGGRKYSYTLSWSDPWSGSSRLASNLMEDVVAARRGSLTRWILDKFPIIGKIVSVSSDGQNAWIDMGSDDGVVGRDRFVVVRGGIETAILRVTSVSSLSSRATVSYTRDMPGVRPAVGDAVVSRGW